MRYKNMSTAAVVDLLQNASESGGLTISRTHKNGYGIAQPEGYDAIGYAVGGFSSVITVNNHDDDELCAKMINNLIDIKNADGLHINEFLGLWVNEVGDIEIEFSRVFISLSKALEEAKKRKQRYIYDFKNRRAVKV